MKRLILIGFLTLTGHVFAESAAKVLFTQKNVTVNRNGSSKVLVRGASLHSGDQIVTAADSLAHIQYSNGALVNIGSESTYKILAYAPKADVQIKAELSQGKVEIQNTGKIKETLKTPIVSLAILGTQLNVDVASPKKTYVQITKGLVLVRNEFLRPGDSVRVTGDRIENAPFPKEGLVNSPINSPGKIESSSTSTSSSVSGTTTASYSASVVTYVNTVQTTGSSASNTTQVSQTDLATISLACVGPSG